MRQAGRQAGALGVTLTGPRPALQRDPFASGPPAPALVATAAPNTRPAVRKSSVVRGGALACAAVMLGGGAPAALIDGRLCRVGDTVRGFRIERIEAHGVSLGGESRLFLPVGVSSSGEDANVVVTGAAPGDRQGRTNLVEYLEGEGK